MGISRLTHKSTVVVNRLREEKLRAGLSFMINDQGLATDECYIEYPDGRISLVTVAPSSKEMRIVRELNARDVANLRKRLKFPATR